MGKWKTYLKIDLKDWGLWFGAKEMWPSQETDEHNEMVMIPRGSQEIHIGPLKIHRKIKYEGE